MDVERDVAFEACFDSGITGFVNIVSLTLIDNDGGIYWPASTADIVESPAGSGIYCANRIAPTIVGQYTMVWSLDGTYDPSTVGIENLQVLTAATSFPPLTPFDPGSGSLWGPCSAWTSAGDVAICCGDPDPDDEAIYQNAADEAARLLWELSGRLFSGLCTKTVIACEDTCGCGIQVLSRGHVVAPDGCWCWNCGCPSRIKLSGYPVREVTEVVIGGVTLSEDAYRLYDRRFLARIDGGHWPSCGSVCGAEESNNTITYEYGLNPPPSASSAAAQLACELYRACTGGTVDCALPSGTTRIVRQGITIERLSFTSWAFRNGGWHTGLNLVDAFLGAYARYGLPRRPTVSSGSSGQRYARPVGT